METADKSYALTVAAITSQTIGGSAFGAVSVVVRIEVGIVSGGGQPGIIRRWSVEQQSGLMLHRTRTLLVKQRTMLVNSLRGQLAEFGLIAPKGTWSIPALHDLARGSSEAVPPMRFAVASN